MYKAQIYLQDKNNMSVAGSHGQELEEGRMEYLGMKNRLRNISCHMPNSHRTSKTTVKSIL